jgi:hypothetical protein
MSSCANRPLLGCREEAASHGLGERAQETAMAIHIQVVFYRMYSHM